MREEESGQLCQDLLWPGGKSLSCCPGILEKVSSQLQTSLGWWVQPGFGKHLPLPSKAGQGRKHSVPDPLQLGAVRMSMLGATNTPLLSKKAPA